MKIRNQIEQKLREEFIPSYLELIDESHKHSGNRVESHFQVTLVSSSFEGEKTIRRHQRVYRILQEELSSSLHALSLRLYTPDEWSSESEPPQTPDCLHKN